MKKTNMIGKGSYGCVFRPPIACKHLKYMNKKHENDIMKVVDMTLQSNMEEEEISNYVREIDPEYDYFIPLSNDKCVVDEEDENLKECDIYMNDENKNSFRGIFAEYGGINMYEYVQNNKIQGLNIGTVWKWMKHLANGIKLLHKHVIVHLNIKLDNIVLDNIYKPKLIDFGISHFAEDMKLNQIPGFYILYPLFYSSLSVDNINTLYETYEQQAKYFIKNYSKKTNNDIIQKIYSLSRRKELYFDNAIKSNNYFLFENYPDGFDENAGIFKVDVYMLSLSFRNWIINNIPVKESNQNVVNELTNIINDGVDINPYRQLNIDKLIRLLSSRPF